MIKTLRIVSLCSCLILFVFAALMIRNSASATGSWIIKNSMPTARYGPAVGAINGNVYVAGGCCTQFVPPFGRFHDLEVYNPVIDSWGTKASMPLAVYAAPTGVLGGKLYVAGGQASQTDGTNRADLQVYDPVTDSWSTQAPLPFPSAAGVAGVIGGKFYVAGGMNPPNTDSVNDLRMYDPITNLWTSMAPMSVRRAAAVGGVINGILYVAGGIVDSVGNTVTSVEAYDPVINTWSNKASMPILRNGAGAATFNGMLYVVGGTDGANATTTVQVYDPSTDSWTIGPSLNDARIYPGAAATNGTLYVMGGFTGSSTLVHSLEALASDAPDSDGDGVPDATDNCPHNFNPDQTDSDGDGVGDICDTCANDPNKVSPGECGCQVPDTDTDHDGTPDCFDPCPTDPNKVSPGLCGCGHVDTDTDDDGTADCSDACPNDRNKIAPGACGCGVPDTDTDGDGIPDCHDNCPATFNPDQLDSNNDGIGDACTLLQFPAGGVFVIGDNVNTATGATIYFWGSQWAQNNPMSGGAAPNSFKGFENASEQTTCGASWISQPGNSSSPPASLPQYMAVIVSSSIQKNGSVIAGDVRKIVIVKTKPGYGPWPGHAGLGEVVSSYCTAVALASVLDRFLDLHEISGSDAGLEWLSNETKGWALRS
jgi:N-acetylneuraminic acid mutarotase